MEFDWDETKNRINIFKHNMAFEIAVQIFSGPTFEFEDDRFVYDEPRYITLGLLGEHILAVAHCERGGRTRIISARKANRYEQTLFYQAFS